MSLFLWSESSLDLKITTGIGVRDTVSFGVMAYMTGIGDKTITPLPLYLKDILDRVEKLDGLRDFDINQVTFNVYRKDRGDCITKHVDDRRISGPAIGCISLGAQCTMRFEPIERENDDSKDCSHTDVPLPPRSLQIMTNDVRYKYTHAVSNESIGEPGLRVSIILRSIPLRPKRTFREF